MFAVIETGGKQYKVTEGDTVLVDLMDIPENETKVVFDKVLLIESDKKISVGQPTVENATVEGEFVSVEKGKKIHVFKMKRRKSTKKKIGHRQKYSMVKILKINETVAKPKKAEAKKIEEAPVKAPKPAEAVVDKPKKVAESKAAPKKEEKKATPKAVEKKAEDKNE